MKIFVRIHTGARIVIDGLDGSEYVDEIKKILEERCDPHLPAHFIRLIHSARDLQNNTRLSDHNVKDGAGFVISLNITQYNSCVSCFKEWQLAECNNSIAPEACIKVDKEIRKRLQTTSKSEPVLFEVQPKDQHHDSLYHIKLLGAKNTIWYGLEMEIPKDYPDSLPSLKCLTPLESHPCIKPNGQLCVYNTLIESAFDNEQADLLTCLSRSFWWDPVSMRGEGEKVFHPTRFLEEKARFLAKWKPSRTCYFPAFFVLQMRAVLLCHLRCKRRGEGRRVLGAIPKGVLLMILGELGRLSLMNQPYKTITSY